MSRILRVVGYLLFGAGALLIAIGTVTTGINHGLGAALELLSPFNVINFISMILTLAPGLALLFLADKLKAKNQR